MNLKLTPLDLLLILGVSGLVTAIAFVHRPRVKALVFSFPIPFILANLAIVLLLAVTLLFTMEARVEPGHRTELPVALKFLAVSGVVTVVVLLKNILGGFMTTFPLAGIVTVYETRRSLWTLSRQAPLLVVALATMMMVMRVCQQQAAMSVPLSLLPGLGAWLAIIVPFTIVRFRREGRMEHESPRP